MSTKPLAEREDCREVLKKFPTLSGVYLMKNVQGDILYVGKAKNLRNRIRSYFFGASDTRPSVIFLRRHVVEIDTVTTPNENDAFLLENTLIKRHHPRYNVQLRDGKTYVGIRLSIHDQVPRLSVVRQVKKDGAEYFGPFPSAGALREVMRVLQKVFGVRNCSDSFFRNRSRPCIEYQIGRCLGPCVAGLVTTADYQEAVAKTKAFFRGEVHAIVEGLKAKMTAASEREDFETALKYRDQMTAIETTLATQVVASHRRHSDCDVFGLYRHEGESYLYILFLREGQVVGGQGYDLAKAIGTDPEIISSVLFQRYAGDDEALRYAMPGDIFVPVKPENFTALQKALKVRGVFHKRFRISYPQRGEKLELVKMATENAKSQFERAKSVELRNQLNLEELAVKLHLPQPPQRIECFDISNFQGAESVGSMVVFVNGEASKKDYRHFNIKGVGGIDDFKMLSEVLSRRMKHSGPLPDLLIVDGGKGQLSAAVKVLKDLGFDHVRLAGMAKARTLSEKNYFKSRGPQRSFVAHEIHRSEERIFLPNRSNAVLFPRGSGARFLLERIRDEAHRFAITHHRKRRKKATLKSALDAVVGLGPKTRNHLLRVFGSVAVIQQTSVDELVEKGGIDRALAERIKR